MNGQTKRALVTGGSAGLGKAVLKRLAADDFDIALLDKEEPLSDAPRTTFFQCDLASRAELDAILPQLIAAGPYDLVILNAGISATGRFEQIPAQTHVDVLRVNAEAPMVIAARLFEAGSFTRKAAIAFVSSLSHFTGYPGAAAYAASKDALAIYAKSMRRVAVARDVSITVAFPGPLRTAHAETHAPQGADASKRMDPDLAASLILADVFAGRKTSVPGRANRLVAIAGRIAPKPVTALMRRLIYDRLDR